MGEAFLERLDRFVDFVRSARRSEPSQRDDQEARVGQRPGPPESVLGEGAGVRVLSVQTGNDLGGGKPDARVITGIAVVERLLAGCVGLVCGLVVTGPRFSNHKRAGRQPG